MNGREKQELPATPDQIAEIKMLHGKHDELARYMGMLAGVAAVGLVVGLGVQQYSESPAADRRRNEIYQRYVDFVMYVYNARNENIVIGEEESRKIFDRVDTRLTREYALVRMGSTLATAGLSYLFIPNWVSPLSKKERNYDQLTMNEAELVIQKLKMSNAKFQPYYGYYNKFLCVLMTGLIFEFMLNGLNGITGACERILWMGMLAHLLGYYNSKFFDYQKKDQLLAAAHDSLNNIFKEIQDNTWRIERNSNSPGHHFSIEMQKNKKISADVVAEIVKNIFKMHEIPFESDGILFRIGGDIHFTNEGAAHINKKINDALLAIRNIKMLRTEMMRLGMQLGVYFRAKTNICEDGMPSCDFVAQFNDVKLTELHIKHLMDFFGDSLFVEKNFLKIIYSDTVNFRRMSELLSALGKIKQNNQSENRNAGHSVSLFSMFGANRKLDEKERGKGKAKERDADKDSQKSNKSLDGGERKAQSASSSSTAKGTDWSTVTSSKVHKIENVPNAYLASELTANDFKSLNDYKTLQRQLECPKPARKEDSQGVAFTFGFARDASNRQFQYDAKIKFLGSMGDCRVYCEEIAGPDNKVLYLAKGVKYHSHRRRY